MARKIDTSTIQGYAEMSVEDKLKALEGFEYEDNTAELERLKNSVSKANGEAAEWKRKHNELLSEEDRAKAEREEEQKKILEELETFRRSDRISKHKVSLMSNGFSEKNATEAAEALEAGDTARFYAVQKSHIEEVQANLKKELLGGTPTPPNGAGTSVMTKAAFLNLDSKAQAEYIALHPNWSNELK